VSININTKNVNNTNTGYPIKIIKNDPELIPAPTVFSKKTLASYECAKDKAQRRKYEAV